MNTSLESNLLFKRAEGFDLVRSFFKSKHVLEVDCPALSQGAPIDLHIDVMQTGSRYLHTSPEYPMKRLLTQGAPDIYQLSHVFREGEIGPFHNPEFTMLEWYRKGFSFQEMIQETLELLQTFLGSLPTVQITYQHLFQKHLQIDPLQISQEELFDYLKIPLHLHTMWDKDTLLHLAMSTLLEPKLSEKKLYVVTHFPSSQAALSKIEGSTALRFEIYAQKQELANGYEELTDPIEQKSRFEKALQLRAVSGKPPLPVDHFFLKALEQGLPPCCGVAVGFDRLLQLKHNCKTLQEVLPFPWDLA